MTTLKVDDTEVKRLLSELAHKMHDMSSVMKEVADQLEATVRMNFKAQGRPDKWPPSKRALRENGETLRDTGRLRESIQPDHGRDFAEVGTSVKYAPTHQFGAKKGSFGKKRVKIREHERRARGKKVRVREHYRTMTLPWGDIPARPFMVVPDEDLEEIIGILADFLVGEA